MALPLALAPALAKMGSYKIRCSIDSCKRFSRLGGAAKVAASAAVNPYTGSGALPTVAAAKTRMAAEALANPAFKSGIGKTIFGNMSKGQIAGRIAPDAFFGGLAALQTPGDLGDKLIAGGTSALGGSIGGLALGRAGQRFGDTAGFFADMAGSVGGDMVGMTVGDSIMRGKDSLMGGAGQTPYERMSAQQQAQFAEQIRQQTLAGAGLLPGLQDRYFDNTGMI
jgi:hypothetical protein